MRKRVREIKPETVDLRGYPSRAAHDVTYERLATLPPGHSLEILLGELPYPFFETLNRQLRGRICWKEAPTARPWRVFVWHRDDGPVLTLGALLGRDHERLDTLFAIVLTMIEGGRGAEATVAFSSYASDLRRHINAENALTLRLRIPLAMGRDPITELKEEHERIITELDLIERVAANEVMDSTIAPLFALFSGLLAKHEGREEQVLFPVWDLNLRHLDERSRADLLGNIKEILVPN
ncbi:MAG: hemerythrin domain-containing protein [Acidiferrobacteraceae bacterium]